MIVHFEEHTFDFPNEDATIDEIKELIKKELSRREQIVKHPIKFKLNIKDKFCLVQNTEMYRQPDYLFQRI